ncbi:arsenic transporter [Xaviernesmea oryzae]|uniref:Arsenic transporter n=1 Tax=Xaviernesmea oryzae TaxID=464029 RepID=A0A1Q9ARD4_9HYPH|nr:arsenic transporter [Xaviernesmea oryzae]OLP57939.1 arsenic transporter [Xaviernesmea oryzae]SEL29939.1 arsenical pump membrane protein [Xaviernesmea oryzae]
MTSLTWAIAGLATAGVIARPMRWPEWIWAVSGALLLIMLGLIPPDAALHAIGEGMDVYLFLIGMMLLSETARAEGLFDWLAATAVNHAKGSTFRLFVLVYLTGTLVTVFLSNDATAVVLTPAVFAAARAARAEPLPLLFACALIANAASFVLPISNPANLVLYGGQMPALSAWFASFALPSLASVGVTFLALWFMERKRLSGACARAVERKPLGRGGIAAFAAIALTAILLIVVSALDMELGLPTAIAGILSLLGVCILTRRAPLPLVKEVSWGVLLLVAGLFVLVEALNRTGVIAFVAGLLSRQDLSPTMLAAAAGTVLAFGSNLINNLPAGLITSLAVQQATPPRLVIDSLLISVDLGPNLSVTGSLATILWLQAIRREGEDVGFWRFLKVGAVVMPTALLAALGTRLWIG